MRRFAVKLPGHGSPWPRLDSNQHLLKTHCGGGGIRTHGGCYTSAVFLATLCYHSQTNVDTNFYHVCPFCKTNTVYGFEPLSFVCCGLDRLFAVSESLQVMINRVVAQVLIRFSVLKFIIIPN